LTTALADVGKAESSAIGSSAFAPAVGDCTLADSTFSIGAGAAISEGRKIRALTASSATKNTSTIRKGAIYCRKIAMFGVNVNVSEKRAKLCKALAV
jgi:hypothetical protein